MGPGTWKYHKKEYILFFWCFAYVQPFSLSLFSLRGLLLDSVPNSWTVGDTPETEAGKEVDGLASQLTLNTNDASSQQDQ